MANALIIGTYALLAAIGAIGFLSFGGFQVEVAGVLGVLSFLMFCQIHGGLSRIRLRKRLGREIGALREANVSVKSELDETRRKMTDVTTALAKRSDAQEKKMISELQIIEGLVREFATNMARKLPSPQRDAPALGAPAQSARVPAESELLEIIRRALEENRVDLYLQPAVSLPQRKVRFYEALSRLRSEDGTVIVPEQYIKVAAPAGLMSVVDNLLLFRCVQVVRRMTQKQRDVAVFCNISGHTLRDAEFFPQFLDFMHQHRDLAGQIVFEFAQKDVFDAGPREETNLRYLAGLGFGLSMDHVNIVDLDFGRLRELGFRYFKVAAKTMVSGMRAAHSAVAAEDFKDLLSRNGVQLIVERIEDEKTVVQLLEYNIDCGQGYLFGKPRPVREIGEVQERAHVTPAPAPSSTKMVRRLAS